jgi:hypothetical protein
LLKTPDVVAFDPCSVETIEMVGAELGVRLLVPQNVEDDDEQTVGNRHRRLVATPPDHSAN